MLPGMRHIIYGAGAIGGSIGARLHQHGHDVVLIARGAHLQALQARGLVFKTPDETVTLPIPTLAHPSELRLQDGDVVYLCMKSQHTLSAIEQLRAAADDELPVICCQNGVANERMALRHFRRVYGMLVFVPATHLEPGVVLLNAKGTGGVLDAGLYPSGVDARIEEVTAALEDSKFSARADPTVMRLKYAKLLANLNNALQAACDAGQQGQDISKLLREEARTCYQAAGIDCAGQEESRKRWNGVVEIALVPGQERFAGSSWQSIVRGQGSIEADWLNGEIVQLGRLHGVPTPANRALQQIGNALARDRAKPGSVSLDAVRARIEQARRK